MGGYYNHADDGEDHNNDCNGEDPAQSELFWNTEPNLPEHIDRNKDD